MMMGPFSVNPDNAHEALISAWADLFDQIGSLDGKWSAHWIGAPADEMVTGSTPDELNRKMRIEWYRHQPHGIPAQRGPEGLPPS
jgi:hypothetical protein